MFVALCKQTRDAACASWLNFVSAILYTQITWTFFKVCWGLRPTQPVTNWCSWDTMNCSSSIAEPYLVAHLITEELLSLPKFSFVRVWGSSLCFSYREWSCIWPAGPGFPRLEELVSSRKTPLPSPTESLTIIMPSPSLPSRSVAREFLHVNSFNCSD